VPSPREPGPGAAQPNRKCERFWTLPRIVMGHTGTPRPASERVFDDSENESPAHLQIAVGPISKYYR
jgi:hypothetical protein